MILDDYRTQPTTRSPKLPNRPGRPPVAACDSEHVNGVLRLTFRCSTALRTSLAKGALFSLVPSVEAV